MATASTWVQCWRETTTSTWKLSPLNQTQPARSKINPNTLVKKLYTIENLTTTCLITFCSPHGCQPQLPRVKPSKYQALTGNTPSQLSAYTRITSNSMHSDQKSSHSRLVPVQRPQARFFVNVLSSIYWSLNHTRFWKEAKTEKMPTSNSASWSSTTAERTNEVVAVRTVARFISREAIS